MRCLNGARAPARRDGRTWSRPPTSSRKYLFMYSFPKINCKFSMSVSFHGPARLDVVKAAGGRGRLRARGPRSEPEARAEAA